MTTFRPLRFLPIMITALLALMVVDMPEAEAQRRAPRKREVVVPVDVGIGPAAFLVGGFDLGQTAFDGPVYEDQAFHFGLRLTLAAVIDREWAHKNRSLIPRQHRAQLRQMREVRIRPMILALVPTSLFISPKLNNTSIYGATWNLISLGVAMGDPISLRVAGGLLGTYAYINSDTLGTTHFLRPGVDLMLQLEIPIRPKEFLISFGWASQFYIPQKVGGSVMDGGESLNDSIWHIGQLFFLLHFRVPYTHQM